MKDISNEGDARMASLRTAKWRDEIEQAVDRIKESASRSASDRWFRKLWYIAEARRKKERQVEKNRARRRQIGGRGDDENGKGKRRDEQPRGSVGRPIWNDAVLCGSALEGVQERAEAARILGFRE